MHKTAEHSQQACTVDNIVQATAETIILTCRPPQDYQFSAGQYAFLQTESMPEPRAYSIASPEHSDTVAFHIKKSNYSNTTDAFMALQAGEQLQISTPQGNSFLDRASTAPLIALAGGVGVAPMHSILMTAIHDNPDRVIHLYWGCDNTSELYLHDHFVALSQQHKNFDYTPIIRSHEDNIAIGVVGEHIVNASHSLRQADIYMAGPKNMMVHTLEVLEKHGIQEDHIHFDKFW